MLSEDEDLNEDDAPSQLKINTLVKGFVMKFTTLLTKAELIEICEDLESNAGGSWKPLAGRRMGVRRCVEEWENASLSKKEFVFTGKRANPHKFKEIPLTWPEVEDNARTIWKDDYTLAVKPGYYTTQFVALGEATRWTYEEVSMVRDAFVKKGVQAPSARTIRQLSYRPAKTGDN
jgi:hypothetical protein